MKQNVTRVVHLRIDENAREMTTVFFSFLLKSRSAGVEVHSSASRVKAQAKRSLVEELQRGHSAESNSELASYGHRLLDILAVMFVALQHCR